MEAPILERFRNALYQRRNNLVDWLRNLPPDKRFASHNGHDHAIAEASDLSFVVEADRALKDLDHGTFGRCVVCHGDIEPERLELDFTTSICLGCYEEAELRALERDLELAALVQQQLFPREVPELPGVQIAAHAMPGRIVSGDYYDFFRFRNGEQGIVVADVMGAGLPASILMSNLQASIRILANDYDRTDRLAARLNELYRYNLKLIRFISMCLLSIHPDRTGVTVTNAGHQPPLVWSSTERTFTWIKPNGPALGLLPDARFSYTTHPVHPGDLVVLCTDGLIEAKGDSGLRFDENGLCSFITEHHDESAEEILTALWRDVKEFSGGRIADDAALMVVKFV